jgi:hypothetical protein
VEGSCEYGNELFQKEFCSVEIINAGTTNILKNGLESTEVVYDFGDFLQK